METGTSTIPHLLTLSLCLVSVERDPSVNLVYLQLTEPEGPIYSLVVHPVPAMHFLQAVVVTSKSGPCSEQIATVLACSLNQLDASQLFNWKPCSCVSTALSLSAVHA